MAEWFRRKSEKIKTSDKREIAEGMWLKCPQCQEVVYRKMLEENHFICTNCTHHFRITSDNYIQLLMDDGKYEEIAENVQSVDPLNFKATKNYTDQIRAAQEKTGNKDAVKTLVGNVNGIKAVLAIMDFSFIGGSMGSVVGEKISQAIDRAAKDHLPLVIITASGGARMQEGAYSLMQMAKISSKLARYSDMGGIVHYSDNRSHHWRNNCQFCHAWRYYNSRTQCPHWLCRRSGHKTNYWGRFARRIPTV